MVSRARKNPCAGQVSPMVAAQSSVIMLMALVCGRVLCCRRGSLLVRRPSRPSHGWHPAGDWDRAWDIFESAYPVETDEFPALEDLLAYDPDAEEKALRRARELALQVRAGPRLV